MKLGSLVHHVHGYKTVPPIFKILPWDLVLVFQSKKKNGVNFCLTLKEHNQVPHVPFHTKYPSQTAVAVSL